MALGGYVRVAKRELPALAREQCKRELTIFPVSTSSYNPSPDPVRLWVDEDEHLLMPRGYFNEVVRKRFQPSFEFVASDGASCGIRKMPPIPPRPGQAELVEKCYQSLVQHEFGGVILEAGVGSGKTACTLELARRLGGKTLVVVHTTVLLSQWKEEIRKFFPEASVGIVQGSVLDTQGKDICVAILNSVAMKDNYPDWLYTEFGTIIFDEVHKLGGQEFSKALLRFRAKYVIGASGTLKRSDRAENIFIHGIGPTISVGQVGITRTPTIFFVDTRYVISNFSVEAYSKDKHSILNRLCYAPERNKIIVDNAVKAAMKGRHVLVLSERVQHVEVLFREIAKHLVPKDIKVGMMVGSSTEAERKYTREAQVIVATAQLLSVGFNNPRMDTLIFASPQQQVVQSVGRIVRDHPEKHEPIVLDLVETQSKGARVLAKSRMKKYLEKGWKVANPRILDDPTRIFNGGHAWKKT